MTCEVPNYGRDVPNHEAQIPVVAHVLKINGFGSYIQIN